MKKLQYFVLLAFALGVVLVPQFSAQAAYYTYSAYVSSTELVGTKPIPTLVTWQHSGEVEDGNVTLASQEVVLKEDSIEVGRVAVAADATSFELNKTNFPAMRAYTRYDVSVDEFYTDGTSNEGYGTGFYTAPPKLKNVRVTGKTLEADGDMTLTLKWRQPTSLKGEYIYYDYKIAKFGKPDSLVLDANDWGDIDSSVIANLPTQKMQVRMRARDPIYGVGEWSKWTVFNAIKK